MDFKQIMKLYKDDPFSANELTREIFEEYKNVNFNFKAGLSVGDIKRIIKNEEDRTGRKVKLLITDYLECLAGPYSDATANTGFICQQLKDLANELQLCSVLLLQTQKHSTGEISDPLLSMRQIKGSSVIEQSCSTVLTLWREGYSPDTVTDDKYISFALVKNRFGSLWRDDFAWAGKTGDIYEMTEEQQGELAAFKERKKLAKIAEAKEKSSGWE
jgi:replicative DNA helicase